MHDAAVPLTLFRDWVRDDWAEVRDRDSLTFATEPVAEHVVRLTKQIGALRSQVQELSAAVAVLLKAVAADGTEAGAAPTGITLATLEARIEREHGARCEVRTLPPVVCVRCKKTVPAHTTEITAQGVVCETKCT